MVYTRQVPSSLPPSPLPQVLTLYSYDNVVPSSELGGVSVEAPRAKSKQWWVSSRWLTDSDLYNEWMNEEDYELLLVVRRRGSEEREWSRRGSGVGEGVRKVISCIVPALRMGD